MVECVTLIPCFAYQVHVQGITSFAHMVSVQKQISTGREHSYKSVSVLSVIPVS